MMIVVNDKTCKKVKNKYTPRQIENSVYGYLQALRALNKVTVDLLQISTALGISLKDAKIATDKLCKKNIIQSINYD